MQAEIPADLATLAPVYAGRVALALVILLAFWLAGRAFRGLVARVGRRDVRRVDLYGVLGSAVFLTVLGFGVISALGTVGVDVTAMVAGVGIVGISLGFALKDIVSNFTAGVMLITYQPFSRGDTIEISGAKGEVQAIDMRYTRLRGEGADYLVPNQNVVSNVVVISHRPAAGPEPGTSFDTSI